MRDSLLLFLNVLTIQRKLNYSNQNMDKMSMWAAHFHILNSSVSWFLEGRRLNTGVISLSLLLEY